MFKVPGKFPTFFSNLLGNWGTGFNRQTTHRGKSRHPKIVPTGVSALIIIKMNFCFLQHFSHNFFEFLEHSHHPKNNLIAQSALVTQFCSTENKFQFPEHSGHPKLVYEFLEYSNYPKANLTRALWSPKKLI